MKFVQSVVFMWIAGKLMSCFVAIFARF